MSITFVLLISIPLFLLLSLRCFRHPKRLCIGAQKYIICQKHKTFWQIYHSTYIISYITLYRSSKDCGLFIHLTFVIMSKVVELPVCSIFQFLEGTGVYERTLFYVAHIPDDKSFVVVHFVAGGDICIQLNPDFEVVPVKD